MIFDTTECLRFARFHRYFLIYILTFQLSNVGLYRRFIFVVVGVCIMTDDRALEDILPSVEFLCLIPDKYFQLVANGS